LDLLKRPEGDHADENEYLVRTTLSSLQQQSSNIARRGVQLLTQLLYEKEKLSGSASATNGLKRKADSNAVGEVVKRIKVLVLVDFMFCMLILFML